MAYRAVDCHNMMEGTWFGVEELKFQTFIFQFLALLDTVDRFITPEVVARAVARLLEAGQPGEVITVGPDNTAYTVPSAGLAVFLGCKLAHSLLSALGLVAAGEVVTVRKLGAALLVLLLASFTLLHLALSHLGL